MFTPKSLLRHPKCISKLSDLTHGGFQELIDDTVVKAKDVRKVIFCQGKIYYDLLAKQEEAKAMDTALVRIEQLHPLPVDQIIAVLDKYSKAEPPVWVQEEPENMGAWPYLAMYFPVRLEVIARPASGAPATGSSERSTAQQADIVARAFRKKNKKAKATA